MTTSSLTKSNLARHWQVSTLVQTLLTQTSSLLQAFAQEPQWKESLLRL